MKTCFLSLLLSCVAFDAQLSAQCTDNTIRTQLTALTEDLGESGYATTYLTRCDALEDGSSRYHDVQVYAGLDYRVVAVCDGSTAGVGLQVYDHQGRLLAERIPGGEMPALTFTPKRSRNVKIKVTLADCQGAPCYYGLRLQAE
jgi:hypothetical protein